MDESVNLHPRASAKGQATRYPVVNIGALVSQLWLGAFSGPGRVNGTSVAVEVWKKNPYFTFASVRWLRERPAYAIGCPSSNGPLHGVGHWLVSTLTGSVHDFDAAQNQSRAPGLPIRHTG